MATRFAALAFVLAALGIAGFLTGNPLFGVFEVTPLLNALHLAAAAIAAVAASRGLRTMRAWGQVLGYIFAALAVAGFTLSGAAVGDLLPLTDSNAWFHLLVALVFIYYALLSPPF